MNTQQKPLVRQADEWLVLFNPADGTEHDWSLWELDRPDTLLAGVKAMATRYAAWITLEHVIEIVRLATIYRHRDDMYDSTYVSAVRDGSPSWEPCDASDERKNRPLE